MDEFILFEANEIPFRVLDDFVQSHPDSTIAMLLAKSSQFTTICDDTVELDPWISWATLHRGVIDNEHGIYRLGQLLEQIDTEYPPIWRMLASNGVKTGVFGSLHSNHIPNDVDNYSFYVPDFFSEDADARPSYMRDFQRFNLGMTRRSARNVDTAIPVDLISAFVRSCPQLGLSLSTMHSVADQLLSEARNKGRRIRRRSLQALLMGDIYVELLRRYDPQFSTFYTNHVAAAMHRYWAASFPEDYEDQQVTPEWQTTYKDEIADALKKLDRILAKLVNRVTRTGGKLLITSSMGQGAVEHQGVSRGFVTITDIDAFMAALGCPKGSYTLRHAMVPLRGVVVEPEQMAAFLANLDAVTIAGHRFVRSNTEVSPLSYGLYDNSFVSLFVYFDGNDKIDPASPQTITLIGNRIAPLAELGIGEMPHEDGVSVTAHHRREGSLLIYDASTDDPLRSRDQISTTELAPAILEYFGVAAPQYMHPPSQVLRQALRAA